MSTMIKRIEQSGWSLNVVGKSLCIIGKQLGISWIEQWQELMKTEDVSTEQFRLEIMSYELLKRGEFLLRCIQQAQSSSEYLLDIIGSFEVKDVKFARSIGALRKEMAYKLSELGEQFSDLGTLNVWLSQMLELLRGRNASVSSLLVEENLGSMVSSKERQCAEKIEACLKTMGWKNIPIGEREDTVLALSQHFYALGDFSHASELLVDALDTDLDNPLIYNAYFIVGLAAEEYESALGGYNALISQPELALTSEPYQIQAIVKNDRLAMSCTGVDTQSEAPVAINVLKNPSKKTRDNIRKCLELEHEIIVKILSFGEKKQLRPCVVVESTDGPTIKEYIEQEGPLALGDCLEAALQISSAIAYAHQNGVVHGVLSPSQLVLHDGLLKIINFGMCPFSDWPLPLKNKDFADISYFSPAVISSGPAKNTDVYSIAATLYYLLTGEDPDVIDPQKIPAVVKQILLKAFTLQYNDAGEFLKELEVVYTQVQEGGPEAPQETPSAPAEVKEVPPQLELPEDRVISLDTGETIVLPEQFIVKNEGIFSRQDDSEMVFIPAGPVNIGSNERLSEKPVHEVHISHFLIDKHPITNIQYGRFLQAVMKNRQQFKGHENEPPNKNYSPKDWRSASYKKFSEGADYPIIYVDWWDAAAYAKWSGKTLPTEAQWEKAAKGTDERKYPWGNEEPNNNLVNFGNNYGKTSPVGAFADGASPYGCLHMAGNVWEWCVDAFDRNYYRNSPEENPVNLATNTQSRVLRGGSWKDSAASIRTTVRGNWINNVRYEYIGFRCAYPISKESIISS